MTYEKVLEIFREYLDQDAEVEVILTKRGYVRVQWAGNFDFCEDGKLAHTPEELFDLLIDDCQSFEEIRLTKGKRELTKEDTAQVKQRCQYYQEKRKELEKC